MPLHKVYLDPSPGFEPGWAGPIVDSFNRPKGVRVRESKPRETPPDTTDAFDDTFKLAKARLREGLPRGENNGHFARGIPTNGKTSSKNYSPDLVRMIDGEHKTLLNVGKINEAMEDDTHDQHITEHRMLLASDDLSETQRNALLEHISSHVKAKRHQQKIVENAQKGKYQKGLGYSSRAKPATTYDVIPQDDPQSAERKRTAGITSMEASRQSRFQRFRQAVNRSRRRGL
jgi:hypothetical protein